MAQGLASRAGVLPPDRPKVAECAAFGHQVRHAVNEKKDMVAELSEASCAPPPSSRLPAPSSPPHGAGASASYRHNVPEGAAPNGKPANLSC